MLAGSDKQFEVGYDSRSNTIMLTRGMTYTVMTNLKAYHIGGSNCFKLQDLGFALDLGVSYDSTTRIISIENPGQPS